MTITSNSGLILEGGGMRGVFTSGVLDCLMDKGIRFPYTIGVSAGACNGLSYMSNQRGRAKFSNIDLFDTFPNEIIPYDYEKLASCEEHYEMVTTSCKTGKACYYEEKINPSRIIDIVKASSSLPFVCPIAYVDGEPMLDGGIADSIPIMRARELGYDNNVVVLTRNKGYRKTVKEMKYVSMFYKEYPAMQEAIRQRNKIYNEQISMIEAMEDRGEIVVIRPQKPVEVDRMERDTKKLLTLYEEGYQLTSSLF